MKTACLLCVVIGCAVLAHGASRIASPGQASQQTPAPSAANDSSRDSGHAPATGKGGGRADGKFSDGQRAGSLISGRSRPGRHVGQDKPISPVLIPNRSEHSASGGTANIQPGSGQAGRAAKGGLTQNEAAGKFLPIRSGAARTTAPSLNNVARYRGVNPPAIGGAVSSRRTNVGSINGTGMHRKP